MVQNGNLEKQIERHIGCLAGFIQIFDPLPGRRRRIRSSPGRTPGHTSLSDGGSACSSLTVYDEIPSGKASLQSPAPQPDAETVPIKSRPKTPAVLFPVFEFKEGGRLPWKFSKEAPRLSLDGRAVTDARGSLYPWEIRTVSHTEGIKDEDEATIGGGGDEDAQRRSPSVIARLMGLENMPSSNPNDPQGKMELRRSTSDSRASKEIYEFIEEGSYSCDYPRQSSMASIPCTAKLPMKETGVGTKTNARRELKKSATMQLQKGGSVQRKSYYNSVDFFPEFNRSTQTVTLNEEIRKKLQARGINEPVKDLGSLKQILEAMQLKGLLHCKAGNGIGSLHKRSMGFDSEDSPIVLMRPRSFSGSNRSKSHSPSHSPIRGRVSTWDSIRANTSNGRRPPEDRKKASSEQGRILPARSPRAIAARKAVLDHIMTYRTYRGGNFAEEKVITVSMVEKEASNISESSISTPSGQIDTKLAEGYKKGRSLLERCDNLLYSIAEITAASATTVELQPSPVSVLDRSIFHEFDGPSLTKRGLHFKDCSSESTDEDAWIPETRSDDCDFAYVSDVVCASNYFPGDPDLFELLEKRWYLRGKDKSSPASRLPRKLTFDVVLEILDRSRQLRQWKHALWTAPELEKADLGQTWSEYCKITQNDSPEDMLESVLGILRKDITRNAAGGWWVGQPVETTESAVSIERLIFKDLIGETIRELTITITIT